VPKPKKKTNRASKTKRTGAVRKAAKPKPQPKRVAKARKPRPAAAARPRSAAVEQPSPEHQKAYVDTLIENGQAAHLDKDGKLPSGATHKIVETDSGQVKVVRRRFSIA
jgi:hypothetical protein